MRIYANPLPFALAVAAQADARSLLRRSFLSETPAPSMSPRPSEGAFVQPTDLAFSTSPTPERLSIYAVDDMPRLTELYRTLLEAAGHQVRAFNDRARALAALKTDRRMPALLITDYLGRSIPVDQFMQACRLIHPGLRILMASGFNPQHMQLPRARPDRFLQKPFSPEEFHQEVRAALGAK